MRGSDYLRTNPHSQLYSYRTGSAGEERAVALMQRALDPEWTIFRNVDLGDRAGDIDIVLVGPGGIWAFEVKNFTGRFHVENGRWRKENRNGYLMKIPRGPGAQARANAARISEYLKKQGVAQSKYVEPVVVMSGTASIEVVSTGTTVWRLEELGARLAFLRSYKRYPQEHTGLIVSVLERACTSAIPLH